MIEDETEIAEGWVDAREVLPHVMSPRSFVSGTREPRRLSVRYLLHSPTRRVRAHVHFDGECEGAAGYVHGAAIAGLFDEALSLLSWYLGHPAATSELNVKYRRFLRLGASATLEGSIEDADGLLVTARGVLRSAEGDHALSRATFVELDEAAVETMRATREAQSADDPDILSRVRRHREGQQGPSGAGST